jgi:LysR family transcriptional activator of nhaA
VADATGVHPRVVAEFDDSALLLAFAGSAPAMFPAPTVIEREVSRLSGARVIGRTEAVRERYVAVSVERKLKHPAVVAITRGRSLKSR